MNQSGDDNDELDEVNELSEELYERLVLRIDAGQEATRIDKFLATRMPQSSRTKIQQAIVAGRVLVNSKTVSSNYKIRPLDGVVVYTDRERPNEEIVPENIPLDIFYEDEAVMIINKLPGMVVHPAYGNYTGTLVNGMAWYLRQRNDSLTEENLPRFRLVHRIDKNTSGLMVMAKTQKAIASLAKQFFDHTIIRQYVALVWGDVAEESGTISAHIGRHQRFRKLFEAYPDGEHGKTAVTHYKVLERFGYVTLVQCVLETGRTQKIRVHMKYLGYPLFNDETYGGDKIVKGTVFSKYKQFVENCFAICPRQALHAKTIGFIHPITGEEMIFESELPDDMKQLIEKWRKYVSNEAVGLEKGMSYEL